MKTKRNQRFPFELKKQAVELYFEGYTSQEVADKLGINHRTRVSEWVRLVRAANSFDVLLPNKGLPRKNGRKKETLQEENERLKLENLYLKKLLDLRKG